MVFSSSLQETLFLKHCLGPRTQDTVEGDLGHLLRCETLKENDDKSSMGRGEKALKTRTSSSVGLAKVVPPWTGRGEGENTERD